MNKLSGPVRNRNSFNACHGRRKVIANGLIVYVGIDHGIAYLLMTKEFLQGSDGHSLIDQKSGKGMA